MSDNVKTGALWERKDDMQEGDQDGSTGESKLFLNRKAQREYRINELFRRKARKQFEKTVGGEEEGEEAEEGGESTGRSEARDSGETMTAADDDGDEEDEAKMRKKRKVSKTYVQHLNFQ